MSPASSTLSPEASRHLAAYHVSRRLGGSLALEIERVRKAVMAQADHLENRPADFAHLVKTAVLHLKRKLPEMLGRGLIALAQRYHLRAAQILTAKEKHILREDWWGDLKNLASEYANLIIQPPSADWLRQLVGPAHSRLTTLINPDDAAAQVYAGISRGWDRRAIAKDLERIFGGFEVSARRIARTQGLAVATQTQLAASESIPDEVIGYEISAVLDERTRPEHRKRDGTRYYRHPKAGQKGFDVMPQPPVDPGGKLAHNCRCFLIPLIAGVDD